jgi:hypothetical protein
MLAVEREAAIRCDDMGVRMMSERRSPGVQHGGGRLDPGPGRIVAQPSDLTRRRLRSTSTTRKATCQILDRLIGEFQIFLARIMGSIRLMEYPSSLD